MKLDIRSVIAIVGSVAGILGSYYGLTMQERLRVQQERTAELHTDIQLLSTEIAKFRDQLTAHTLAFTKLETALAVKGVVQ